MFALNIGCAGIFRTHGPSMQKDVTLALELAREVQVTQPTGSGIA